MSNAILRRVGAAAAASALSVTGLALVTSPAQAATDNRPVTIAATWVEHQLTDGLIHNDQYNFDDIGLTVDAGFGLAAVGGHTKTVSEIADAVAPQLTTGYVSGDEFASVSPYGFVQVGKYGAQGAKALVFAQVAGKDTATWGGLNLVTFVENRIASAPVAGRLNSDSSYGDFTNTIGQAFAARGLTTAASAKAADATTFLLRQQCAAGYFRLAISDATCDADGGTADTDTTAITVQQLAAIASPTQAVTDALANAKTWLLAAQHADGSFGGGASTTASNTNSTSAAGIALGTLGQTAAAAKAAVWVRQHQADELNGCPTPLFAETGALAYNDAATTAARADGITANTEDQWRRATAASLPVLQYAPAATPALALTGPTGFLSAGSSATYTVSGVIPGDKVCLSAFGVNRPVAADANGHATVSLTLPADTANRVVSVKDHAGTTKSVVTKVLGIKTLTVKPAMKNVKRGKTVWVTVSGLAGGEKVTLRYRGSVVATGTASSGGTFVRKIHVGSKLGAATIRKGGTTIKVIR
jgi:hypothetical protein